MPSGSFRPDWLKGAAALFLFLVLFGFPLAVGAESFSAPVQSAPLPVLEEPWERLKNLPPSIPWEASGTFLYEAPGERYRLGFRLLARDPRSLRLELSDPFGRPIYYLVFYQGRTRAVSLADKKVVPLHLPALLSAFPLPSQTRWEDVFLLFWGRAPLFSAESGSTQIQADRDPQRMQFLIHGDHPQIIRVEKEPFRVVAVEVPRRGSSEAIQILFSDFIELSGSSWPKKIAALGRDSEKKLTIQYDQIIPRSDIPEEAFLIPD
jgi:hypothetical protein